MSLDNWRTKRGTNLVDLPPRAIGAMVHGPGRDIGVQCSTCHQWREFGTDEIGRVVESCRCGSWYASAVPKRVA